ncbi:MAG: TetR family transcriptional regulator [Lachnospiraceae bacterium]
MPTDRFNRLSDEKKKIIREAAIKEFARVSFEKASINQIIQNADISRGSFYTYFTDKQDVVSFIFEDSHEQMQEQCLQILKENGGNYFGMLREMFEYFADKSREAQEMVRMVRNVFTYQNSTAIFGLDHNTDWICKREEDSQFAEIFKHVDLTTWWLHDTEDWVALMMMGGATLVLALSHFYQNPDQIDAIRRRLDKKLYLLQYGVYKNDPEEADMPVLL